MTFLLQFVHYQEKSSSKKQFLNITLFNIDFLACCYDAFFVSVCLCVYIYVCSCDGYVSFLHIFGAM